MIVSSLPHQVANFLCRSTCTWSAADDWHEVNEVTSFKLCQSSADSTVLGCSCTGISKSLIYEVGQQPNIGLAGNLPRQSDQFGGHCYAFWGLKIKVIVVCPSQSPCWPCQCCIFMPPWKKEGHTGGVQIIGRNSRFFGYFVTKIKKNTEKIPGIVINFFHNWLILACGLEIYKLNLKSMLK